MPSVASQAEPTTVRRVFAAWSIELPSSMRETWVQEDHGYWHAFDERRSISLSSVVVTDQDRPVSAELLVRDLPHLPGTPVDQMPPGLTGRASTSRASPPAIASLALSGLLFAEGRVLVVTITTDDLDWARRTWLSIRSHPAALQSGGTRRGRCGKHGLQPHRGGLARLGAHGSPPIDPTPSR